MKTTTLLLVLMLLLTCISLHAQWTQVNSGSNANLSVISQNASGSLFTCGKGTSIILKSDNAGANWYNVANHWSGFSDITFLSSGIGLAIPQSTDSIFKSTDGGNTWAKQYSLNCNGPFRGFINVHFTDAMTGYAPGYKTIDGGNSWFSQLPSVQSFPYMPTAITFINDSTGFIAGYDYWGAIAKTTDRGNTWTWVIDPYNTWEIYAIHFPTPQVGYCTSYKYASTQEAEIIKTIDGGDNWTSIYTTALSSLFLSIYCTDANTCYAVGNQGNIAKTTDGGITWNSQYSGTNQTLRKVFFTDANTGYVVGDNGTILKTTNGGGTTSISNEIENKISIFPNPSHGIFTFEIAENYEIEIYNILGEKITTKSLTNSTKTIDLSTYPNNVYFYKLAKGVHFPQMGKLVKN